MYLWKIIHGKHKRITLQSLINFNYDHSGYFKSLSSVRGVFKEFHYPQVIVISTWSKFFSSSVNINAVRYLDIYWNSDFTNLECNSIFLDEPVWTRWLEDVAISVSDISAKIDLIQLLINGQWDPNCLNRSRFP